MKKEIRKHDGKRPLINPPSSSASFLLTARPPRASFHSFQTALRSLHWSSSGHSSTTCVPVILSPHLHLSVSAFLILNSHSFCGPLFDRDFLHHPSSPLFPPPLASALSLLAHALNPAGVSTPSDSCPSMEVCLLILSASSLPLMSLCPLTHAMYVSCCLFSRVSRAF